jgi:hypothetical protein
MGVIGVFWAAAGVATTRAMAKRRKVSLTADLLEGADTLQ